MVTKQKKPALWMEIICSVCKTPRSARAEYIETQKDGARLPANIGRIVCCHVVREETRLWFDKQVLRVLEKEIEPKEIRKYYKAQNWFKASDLFGPLLSFVGRR